MTALSTSRKRISRQPRVVALERSQPAFTSLAPRKVLNEKTMTQASSSLNGVTVSEEVDENLNSSKTEVLQPSTKTLRPHLEDLDVLTRLLRDEYGLTVTRLTSHNGYDDLNFHVQVSADHSNLNIDNVDVTGYFLKVCNSRDSQLPQYLNAQLSLMDHLVKKGVPCQSPIKSIRGQPLTELTLTDDLGEITRHAVFLRTYLPGVILGEVPITSSILYRVGRFTASVFISLEDFSHPFYDSFVSPWCLSRVSELSPLVELAVSDENKKKLFLEVIEEFSSQLQQNKHNFRTGVIHGDLNEQNILVSSQPDSPPDITGLLDYQDSAFSFAIFDLAIIIAYMLMTDFLSVPSAEVAGHVLAGYTSLLPVGPAERAALRSLVAGRMVQSLVMGAHSFSLDPTNQYLLTTAHKGWAVLQDFWLTGDLEAQRVWDSVIQSYQQ